MAVIAGGNHTIAYSQRSRLRGQTCTYGFISGHSVRNVPSAIDTAQHLSQVRPRGVPRGERLWRAGARHTASPLGSSLVTFCLHRKLPLRERFPLQAEQDEGSLINRNFVIIDTAAPPGGIFLVLPQERYERRALRGDAECHAPACQAALP